jgi:hypothetical protein
MNNSKKSFVISLVVTIIVILAVWSILFVTQNKKVEAPVVGQNLATTTDVVKDLKNYTNTKYGFEFNYPSNYYLKSEWSRNLDKTNSLYSHNVFTAGFGWEGKLEIGPYYALYIYDSKDINIWIDDMNSLEGVPEESIGKYMNKKIIKNDPITYEFTFGDDYEFIYYGVIGEKFVVYFPGGIREDRIFRDLAESIIKSFVWLN